jgi:hypothetical protein
MSRCTCKAPPKTVAAQISSAVAVLPMISFAPVIFSGMSIFATLARLDSNSQQDEPEQAMKYLCLAYEAEETFQSMPRPDWDALRQETLAYVSELQQNGTLILTNALQSARTAATLRVRNGRLSVTDGPFAETKEQLGGFFLIEAEDFDAAVRIAAKWPGARFGDIEVRPVEETLREENRY